MDTKHDIAVVGDEGGGGAVAVRGGFFPGSLGVGLRGMAGLEGLTDGELAEVTEKVRGCKEAASFWMADVLREAQRRMGDANGGLWVHLRTGLGEDEMGDLEVLLSLPVRREGLGLAQHLLIGKRVRREEDRQMWLDLADREGLSVADLRVSIAAGVVKREGGGAGDAEAGGGGAGGSGDCVGRGVSGGSGGGRVRGFGSIEGIAGQFRLWLRLVEERLEGADVEWARCVVEETRVMTDTLLRIRRLGLGQGFREEGEKHPESVLPAVGVDVMGKVEGRWLVLQWTGRKWVVPLPGGEKVEVVNLARGRSERVTGWRELV